LFFFAFVKPNTNLFGVRHYCISALYDERITEEKAQDADKCFGVVGYALCIALVTASTVGNVVELYSPRFTAMSQQQGTMVALRGIVLQEPARKRALTRRDSGSERTLDLDGGNSSRSISGRGRLGSFGGSSPTSMSCDELEWCESKRVRQSSSNQHWRGRGDDDNGYDGCDADGRSFNNGSQQHQELERRFAHGYDGSDCLETLLSPCEYDSELPEFEGTLDEFVELAVWLGWVSGV
jgi:hypothetical protein